MSAYKLLNIVLCVWHHTTSTHCQSTIPYHCRSAIHNHTVPYLAVTTNLWSRSGHWYTTKELDILLALSTEAAVATLISPRYHLEASEEREREWKNQMIIIWLGKIDRTYDFSYPSFLSRSSNSLTSPDATDPDSGSCIGVRWLRSSLDILQV